MESIIIKPTLRCNANCPFCEQRLSLYRDRSMADVLSVESWEKVVLDAKKLGVSKVNISGGEPTLYKYLFRLIRFIKLQNMEAHLKTNGFLIDYDYAKKLKETGLDSCTISVYSRKPESHDGLKCIAGSLDSALNALKVLDENGLHSNIQTILTPELMSDFANFILWATKFPVGYIFISYLEGDSSFKRPTAKQIEEFQNCQIPRVLEIIQNLGRNVKSNSENMKNLFRFDDVSIRDISRGIYNLAIPGCGRNKSMAMILATGEVHPCNAIEYFHEPIMGNVKSQSLIKCYESSLWNDIKDNGVEWCNRCPMNKHTFIKLRRSSTWPVFYSSPNEEEKNG